MSLEEGKEALRLARRSIEHYLKEGERPEPPENPSEILKKSRGVFVTLNKNGNLRGCIGRPLPQQSLLEGTIDSAISAATKDPRFRSLTLEELDKVTIEISILNPPELIEVEDPDKYPEEIQIGRDGLIVEGRGREGLLLPQVPVDQEWNSEEFLSQTCIKAGLPPESWSEGDLKVRKFSGEVFKEEEPGGEIVRKNLSK